MNKIRPEFKGKRNSLLDKGFRYISRLILKIFNITSIYRIIKILNFLQKHTGSSSIRYFYYFLYSKLLQQEYLYFLSRANFVSAINKKVKWADLVLKSSDYKYEKYAANDYLNIFSKNGYVNYTINKKYSDKFLKNINAISDKTFYLYGPNANHPPNIKYKDCILIVTKDIAENVEEFKDSILFLNSIYYHSKIKGNKAEKERLLEKYGKVMISSMHYIDDSEFEYSRMPPGSELCGLMAFGRVLYNLIIKNGRINCIIDGYDMYLEHNSYSKYYPTLVRSNGKLNEKIVVQGLADHDFLYDFLKVKELIQHVNLIDSDKFSAIINMSKDEFIEQISSVRNFKLLGQA